MANCLLHVYVKVVEFQKSKKGQCCNYEFLKIECYGAICAYLLRLFIN